MDILHLAAPCRNVPVTFTLDRKGVDLDLFYALPALPVVTRLLLSVYWDWLMIPRVAEAAQERDLHRETILSLAGFSFTAVAALAVLDATSRLGLQASIWFSLVSFLSYVSASNLQSYKSRRWHGQLESALTEMASLSLILTLITLLFGAKLEEHFVYAASLAALIPWALDHTIRISVDWQYLSALDESQREGEDLWRQRRPPVRRLRRKR
ncbi:hypothetical protein [Ramlibacter sp. AN1133]|uniref:hypothetical protein n=1 Tax=Ramlibacter sp. AN1133 TaxID=3133429 RepID=UPI0030BA2FDD